MWRGTRHHIQLAHVFADAQMRAMMTLTFEERFEPLEDREDALIISNCFGVNRGLSTYGYIEPRRDGVTLLISNKST
jgi:hypothetical protein